MRWVHGWLTIGCVGVVVAVASAQTPNLDPNHPDLILIPTVTYERVYPNAEPSHYAISVESSGNAAYHSDELSVVAGGEKAATEPNADKPYNKPYILKFTISESTCRRIFQLARQAGYFKGKPGAGDRTPSGGNRTLTYSEGPANSFGNYTNGVRNWVTYDDSKDPAIRQLTEIFAGISSSIELGREIEYLRQTRHSGLDAALKRAEDRAGEHGFVELQAIAYCLKDVADDPSVSGAARERAEHLLLLARPSPAP